MNCNPSIHHYECILVSRKRLTLPLCKTSAEETAILLNEIQSAEKAVLNCPRTGRLRKRLILFRQRNLFIVFSEKYRLRELRSSFFRRLCILCTLLYSNLLYIKIQSRSWNKNDSMLLRITSFQWAPTNSRFFCNEDLHVSSQVTKLI